MKRPEKAERKDDPKYCKYHRLVGHTIQDSFVFKDKVMQLARQGKISLKEDSATANVIMIKSECLNSNKNSCNVVHGDDIEDELLEKEDSSDIDDCMSTITFTDEDLLLGSKPHNRPLFVVGYVREQKVSRILIDGGSAVNILPLRILKELGIPIDEHSNSRLMIQGFNQGGQRAVGIIRLQLTMEDMVSTALFHVIDAKTSYNMFLGRPWLHENVVVPSTWHRCFEYCRNGIVKKVLGDSKFFTEAESYFADAKYYIEGAKKEKEVLPSEEPKSYSNQSTRKNDSSTIKVELSKDLILPLTQISLKQPSMPPLKGFVPSTQEEEGGHEALAIDEKGFDPKAFKLLVKVGYNPKKKPNLGKLPPEATGKMLHGLNATQIMLKKKGHAVQDSRVGLGFTPPKPVCNVIKRVNSNYVVEGFSSTEDDKEKENPRESVFNRLGPHRKALHGIANRQSIFDSLGPRKRMEYQKKGAFKLTTYSKKTTKSSPTQKLRSLIPSRMRRQTTLAISCGKVLKVKAQTMIFTQVQFDNEDDRKSVASSNYISNSTEEDFAQIYHITLIEDGEIEEEDVEDAPVELEEGVKATVDELREVNLGNTEDPRPIYTRNAWIRPKDSCAPPVSKKGARPVKQGQHRFRPELIPLIETEVNKLIEVGFIREVKYPMWISSIVPVRKKNRQIRVYVDFRDLNNACPKDDFPLPIAELMIDATTGHEALSFMDGSSGYNQIRMAPADEELTVFRTPKGIYCYKVMPFGLKNTGVTYQRAMQRIFDDMLHKNIECYVDDLVVKSKKREDHLYDLRKVFERFRRYQLKMNPSKCAFGVTSGKFLGFIIRQSCDKAFKSIKSYLMKPPILVAPIYGRPLILYVVAQERSVGILLAQKNDEGKENALYYLSRTMTPNELKYSPIEKLCLALIFAIQKLKHYFQSHSIHLVSKANPLKYIMTKPILSDRLARWYLQLQQFEITYVLE
ncbi:UNVERIFIED_CONTAM: putative protein K02A2.6 [Sesamum latifolium]|uniref:RNA-directed DNA polymerase n=1 Tax=Sesamum latifolium TaxID=2727402 RepID=A0AAW2SRM0_9LAMI